VRAQRGTALLEKDAEIDPGVSKSGLGEQCFHKGVCNLFVQTDLRRRERHIVKVMRRSTGTRLLCKRLYRLFQASRLYQLETAALGGACCWHNCHGAQCEDSGHPRQPWHFYAGTNSMHA